MMAVTVCDGNVERDILKRLFSPNQTDRFLTSKATAVAALVGIGLRDAAIPGSFGAIGFCIGVGVLIIVEDVI